MRLAVAIGVIAVTLAAAVYIHQRRVTLTMGTIDPNNCAGSVPGGFNSRYCSGVISRHPSWEDPTAVLLAIGGIAVAVGIVRFVKPS